MRAVSVSYCCCSECRCVYCTGKCLSSCLFHLRSIKKINPAYICTKNETRKLEATQYTRSRRQRHIHRAASAGVRQTKHTRKNVYPAFFLGVVWRLGSCTLDSCLESWLGRYRKMSVLKLPVHEVQLNSSASHRYRKDSELISYLFIMLNLHPSTCTPAIHSRC